MTEELLEKICESTIYECFKGPKMIYATNKIETPAANIYMEFCKNASSCGMVLKFKAFGKNGTIINQNRCEDFRTLKEYYDWFIDMNS